MRWSRSSSPLHAMAFSQVDGGHQWTIQTKAAPGSQVSVQLTLPLTLAEQLSTLTTAQLAYDQARSRIVQARQQLFMDWVIYVKQLSRKPPGTSVVDTKHSWRLPGHLIGRRGAGRRRRCHRRGPAALPD